jgi:hypothetical protein
MAWLKSFPLVPENTLPTGTGLELSAPVITMQFNRTVAAEFVHDTVAVRAALSETAAHHAATFVLLLVLVITIGFHVRAEPELAMETVPTALLSAKTDAATITLPGASVMLAVPTDWVGSL